MKKGYWKHIAVAGLAIVSAVALAACGSSGSKSSSGNSSSSTATVKDEKKNGTLTIWTASDTFKNNAEKWSKETGTKVKVVVIPTADLNTKLKQSVSDAATAPDVFIVSRDYTRDWETRSSVLVNYTQSFPKDAASYKKNAYPSIYKLGTDSNGDLLATSAENPVGMMFYNRKIAKDILGTDDPAEVGKAMNSVKKWEQVNDKIKAKYGNSVKLFGTTLDTRAMAEELRKDPYVKGDTYTIGDDMAQVFKTTKLMYDKKMFVSEKEDAPYLSGYNNNTFFCEFLPSWGFSSKLMPQIKGNSGSGNWAATTPTYSYQRGGSFYFMTKTSKVKATAWKYIKSQTIDSDNIYKVQKSILGYSSNKIADKKLVDSGYADPMLGNQKIFSAYADQAAIQEKDSDTNRITKYDNAIGQLVGDLTVSYGNGSISLDAALKKLGSQVQNAFPQLKIKYTYTK